MHVSIHSGMHEILSFPGSSCDLQKVDADCPILYICVWLCIRLYTTEQTNHCDPFYKANFLCVWRNSLPLRFYFLITEKKILNKRKKQNKTKIHLQQQQNGCCLNIEMSVVWIFFHRQMWVFFSHDPCIQNQYEEVTLLVVTGIKWGTHQRANSFCLNVLFSIPIYYRLL